MRTLLFGPTTQIPFLGPMPTVVVKIAVIGFALSLALYVAKHPDQTWNGVRSFWRSIRRTVRFMIRLTRFSKEKGIRIGMNFIPDEARLRHTHIVGATGCGKTVLMEEIIRQDLARGYGMLIVEPKGDREFYERIRNYCRSIGRQNDLHLISTNRMEESVRWNPCRLGDASELQTKFFNAATYDESFYAKACEMALLKIFTDLQNETPDSFTLVDVAAKLKGYCQGKTADHLFGLYYDLENLNLSEWGPIFCTRDLGKTKKEISLLDVTLKNEILFVELPTESKAVQSARAGRLLLQELLMVSGMRKLYPDLKGRRPFSVFIDEFDSFASPSFTWFLNKGRSSGFMIHMAHQTLSDLERVSKEFSGQIMGNTNVRFVFRQDDPDDAERWARFFGTKTVIKKTYQTKDQNQTGLASNREVQEFIISPNTIRNLEVGRCVMNIKTEGTLKTMRFSYDEGASYPKRRGPIQRDEVIGVGEEKSLADFSAEFDELSKYAVNRSKPAVRKRVKDGPGQREELSGGLLS